MKQRRADRDGRADHERRNSGGDQGLPQATSATPTRTGRRPGSTRTRSEVQRVRADLVRAWVIRNARSRPSAPAGKPPRPRAVSGTRCRPGVSCPVNPAWARAAAAGPGRAGFARDCVPGSADRKESVRAGDSRSSFLTVGKSGRALGGGFGNGPAAAAEFTTRGGSRARRARSGGAGALAQELTAGLPPGSGCSVGSCT